MKSKTDSDVDNSQWANAMKNILSLEKPKAKTSVILSRAEKLDPKLEKDDDEDDKETLKRLAAQANLRKEWISRGRYKPNPLAEGERERKLRRIAVAGVVQLFNAVGKHQRNPEMCTGSVSASSAQATKKSFKPLDKKSFFNLLLGKDEVKSEEETTSKSISTTLDEDIKDEEEQEDNSKWDVLRNDFMMSAKLKDWDKKIEV